MLSIQGFTVCHQMFNFLVDYVIGTYSHSPINISFRCCLRALFPTLETPALEHFSPFVVARWRRRTHVRPPGTATPEKKKKFCPRSTINFAYLTANDSTKNMICLWSALPASHTQPEQPTQGVRGGEWLECWVQMGRRST